MKTILVITIIMLSLSSLKGQNVKNVKGLKVGSIAPVFKAVDAYNNTFKLKEALKEGPVVMIFYRGYWCPVCNKHLGSLQDSLKLIEDRGAKVIAVSPEKPEYLNVMADKTGAEFTLLYDEGYKIANAYDVNFMPAMMNRLTYNVFLGAKLKETHSDESQRLPIPATYIISSEGIIIWRQFDPDYHKRSSVKDILKALNKYTLIITLPTYAITKAE